MKKYNTAKEITDAFRADGWSDNTSLHELTLEEAEEKGLSFAIYEIPCGEKYYVMDEIGNVYDDAGKIIYYNIKCAF